MVKKIVSILVFVAALAPAMATAQSAHCIDPVSFGAIPNDGISDRVAIQHAVDLADGGGTVCLGDGRWTCDRAGPGAYSRTACIATHGKHVTITGSGPGTVIQLLGDQGLQQTIVIAVEPAAEDIWIGNLTIDTTGTYQTDEQTHAIATTSNSPNGINPPYDKIEGLTISGVRFVHPYGVAGERKGDCLRLGSNSKVIDVKVIGSTFAECARSGIELQREIYGVKIIANTFRTTTVDQDIDGEASGGGWVYDAQIIGNTFDDGPLTSGDYSVSCTSCMRLIVADNIFKSRGLILVRSVDAVIHHNIFDATMDYAQQGVIESANTADRLRIEGNTIARHGAPGAAIRVQPHSGTGPPTGVRIEDNTITIDGDSSGIIVDSPVDLRVRDNDVTWTSPTAPNGMGIAIAASSRDAVGIRLRGNTLVGASYHSAIRLTASAGRTFAGVSAVLNQSRGGTRSFRCEQNTAGTYALPIVSSGNQWAVPTTCSTTSGPVVMAPGE